MIHLAELFAGWHRGTRAGCGALARVNWPLTFGSLPGPKGSNLYRAEALTRRVNEAVSKPPRRHRPSRALEPDWRHRPRRGSLRI